MGARWLVYLSSIDFEIIHRCFMQDNYTKEWRGLWTIIYPIRKWNNNNDNNDDNNNDNNDNDNNDNNEDNNE